MPCLINMSEDDIHKTMIKDVLKDMTPEEVIRSVPTSMFLKALPVNRRLEGIPREKLVAHLKELRKKSKSAKKRLVP